MDVLPAWSQDCICGRVFSVPQAELPEDEEMTFVRSGKGQGGLAGKEALKNGTNAT